MLLSFHNLPATPGSDVGRLLKSITDPSILRLPLPVTFPVILAPFDVVSNFLTPAWYASKAPFTVPLKSRLVELASTKSNVSPENSKVESIALTLVFAFRILP